MDSIFKQLFQYGFHDTEISSIDCEGLEVKLNFDKGIYLLDENGKETILSKPMQVILKISSYFDSFEETFEIKEYGKKVKYLEYITLKNHLQKESFGISMCYYSNFNNCIIYIYRIQTRINKNGNKNHIIFYCNNYSTSTI